MDSIVARSFPSKQLARRCFEQKPAILIYAFNPRMTDTSQVCAEIANGNVYNQAMVSGFNARGCKNR